MNNHYISDIQALLVVDKEEGIKSIKELSLRKDLNVMVVKDSYAQRILKSVRIFYKLNFIDDAFTYNFRIKYTK